MGKLAPACAEAAIQGRTWRVPDPSWLPSADGRRAERLMGSRHATSSTPRRPPSPHVIRVSILLFQGGASGAAPGQYQCSRKRHTGHAASGRSPRGARLRRGPGPKHTGVRSTHPTSSRSSAPVPASRAASSSNDPTNIPNPKQPKRSSSTGLELLLPPARRRPLHISTWVVGQFGGRSS